MLPLSPPTSIGRQSNWVMPAWLLRLGQRASPRLRGPLIRLEKDLIAENDELKQLLGISPRPFHPDASTWQYSGN